MSVMQLFCEECLSVWSPDSLFQLCQVCGEPQVNKTIEVGSAIDKAKWEPEKPKKRISDVQSTIALSMGVVNVGGALGGNLLARLRAVYGRFKVDVAARRLRKDP